MALPAWLQSIRGALFHNPNNALHFRGRLAKKVSAQMVRGNQYYSHGDLNKALACYEQAIALGEELGICLESAEPVSVGLCHNLALAHKNRGAALYAQGQLAEAMAAFEQAIELGDGLRARLEPSGQWSPDLRDDFAEFSSNIGNVLYLLGRSAGAAQAYERAIIVRQGLREMLEPRRRWPPELSNRLAAAHMGQGAALYREGRLAEAVAAFDETIDLREALRSELEPRGLWSPALRNDLATGYTNRGNALGSQGRLADAMRDHDRAIALHEGLRSGLDLKARWSRPLCTALATAYLQRGLIHIAQGRLAEAVADHDRGISLHEGLRARLEPDGDWSAELRDSLTTAYLERGRALYDQDRPMEGMADFEQAIALYEETRALLQPQGEPSLERCRTLAAAYLVRGDALADKSLPKEATEDYARAIDLLEGAHARQEPQSRCPPESGAILARAYLFRGAALEHQGRLAEAVADYDRGIALHKRLPTRQEPPGDLSSALCRNLASLYSNRGNALESQQRLTDALADHDQAIKLSEELQSRLEPKGEWSADQGDALAAAYLNRGVVLRAQGRASDAVADYRRAIELRENLRAQLEPLNDWSAELCDNLASAYMNRGNALARQGTTDERTEDSVVADFNRAVELREGLRTRLEPNKGWSPTLSNGLAKTYMNRGNFFVIQGRLGGAFADFMRAIALSETLPEGTFAEVDRLRFSLYVILISLAYIPPRQSEQGFDALSWIRAKSLRMAAFLEQVPVTGAEQSHAPELYQNFALFHARWLAWCVRSDHLDVIPEILAIVQAREVAAEVLDLLSLDDRATPEAVRAYHELRLELRKLNVRIEAVITGGKPAGPGTGSDASRAGSTAEPTWDQAGYDQLVKEHGDLNDRIAAQRAKAAKERGYEYLELPYQPLTLSALKGSLTANEALLLLVHPPEGEAGAVLIRPQGAPHWQPMPELPTLVGALQAADAWPEQQWLDALPRSPRAAAAPARLTHREYTLGGYRRGAAEEFGEAQARAIQAALRERLGDLGERLVDALYQREAFWPALTEALDQFLWAPLAEQLAGLERLAVVPHGTLHLLPLGGDRDRQASRFPGLAFFAQQRGLYGGWTPPARTRHAVGLIAYAGDDDNPIPLTEAEAAALARLYRDRDTEVHHPSAYPASEQGEDLLHIACHGVVDPRDAERSDPQRPPRVGLWIAPEPRPDDPNARPDPILNQDAIIASKAPLTDLYFSACLGGQTVEDLSGTPSGLISACFRRNARWVAGSLVSIPDQWAMLLAVLTHQARVADDLPLPAALAEGKRRLATGAWFKDTGAYLEKVLSEPLQRMIEPLVERFWLYTCAQEQDDAARRALFAQLTVPNLLQDWGALTDAEIEGLHQRLCHQGPETLASALAEALAALWPSRPRIPPEPHLGTLINGLVVFGEAP